MPNAPAKADSIRKRRRLKMASVSSAAGRSLASSDGWRLVMTTSLVVLGDTYMPQAYNLVT
jgi:hypothetical protein